MTRYQAIEFSRREMPVQSTVRFADRLPEDIEILTRGGWFNRLREERRSVNNSHQGAELQGKTE